MRYTGLAGCIAGDRPSSVRSLLPMGRVELIPSGSEATPVDARSRATNITIFAFIIGSSWATNHPTHKPQVHNCFANSNVKILGFKSGRP